MLYRLGVNDLFNTVAGKVVLVTGGSIGIGRYIAGACERTNERTNEWVGAAGAGGVATRSPTAQAFGPGVRHARSGA